MIDDINVYPYIKLTTIKKVVRFFSKGLAPATKNTINIFLDIIRFRMISTLISFCGDYYKYRGGGDKEQGLVIGGYKSTFLADLFASYLLVKSNNNFHRMIYPGIYWYDGLVLLKVNNKVQ